MNLPDSNESTPAARLASARLKQWHQQGEALLTIENARSFLSAASLVLFAPRPQVAAPAPSFVEAVLGAPNAAPTLAQSAPARELLARLVAEGLAVPLNLLGIGSVVGQPGDAPDFIASAQAFSYVFTLRGDKAWKQPPQPAGSARSSYLAIAAHEALTLRGPMSAIDLARELGKEVTEAAVLRSLGELWSHLRVLPLLQPDGRPTLWELATARFTKQIKAGANAGLPTALSALISLYLGQAIVASEDEVESFLSPLAARSRIRDVVHALVAARQLDTTAIDGRTALHVAGAAPEFLSEETLDVPKVKEKEKADVLSEFAAVEAAPIGAAAPEGEERGQIEPAAPGSRIARFVPRRKPGATDLAKAKPAKFARKPSGEPRKSFGHKKPFVPRDGKAAPSFRDEKSGRPFQQRRGFRSAEESAAEGRPRFEKKRFEPRDPESKPRFEGRGREGAGPGRERYPSARGRRAGEDRTPRRVVDSEGQRSAGRGREDRRPFNRTGEQRKDRSDRPARRPFGKPDRLGPKRDSAVGEDRPKREFKPRSFEGRKPFGGAKPFGRRSESGEGREERPSAGFGGKRPFARASGFGKKPGGFSKPFLGKERDGERRERPSHGGSGFGAKKLGSGDDRSSKFGDKSDGRKFGSKPGGARFGAKEFNGKRLGGKKPFGKPKAGRGSKPSRSQGDQEA